VLYTRAPHMLVYEYNRSVVKGPLRAVVNRYIVYKGV
jgi:hypothetical protein